jgi:hypothetical protein
MMISISEFRLNSKKYFDVALNGEPVWITRGGVMYKLEVSLPIQHQLNVPEQPKIPYKEKK